MEDENERWKKRREHLDLQCSNAISWLEMVLHNPTIQGKEADIRQAQKILATLVGQ